jgi:hypothetical protein
MGDSVQATDAFAASVPAGAMSALVPAAARLSAQPPSLAAPSHPLDARVRRLVDPDGVHAGAVSPP